MHALFVAGTSMALFRAGRLNTMTGEAERFARIKHGTGKEYKMKHLSSRITVASLFAVCLLAAGAALAAPEEIVHWGKQTNIVAGADAIIAAPGTYEAHNQLESSASYYPTAGADSKTAEINVSATGSGSTVTKIWQKPGDETGTDGLETGCATSNWQAMVVWEDFIGTNSTLSGLAANFYQGGVGFVDLEYRFLIQKGSGEWFASEVQADTGQNKTTNIPETNPTNLTWYSFSPLTLNAATIGSAASPDMTDIATVGYLISFDANATGSGYQYVRLFEFVAKAEPGTVRSDVVFSYDLEGWIDNTNQRFRPVAGWNALRGVELFNIQTNATETYLVHRPAATAYPANRKGYVDRGMIYTNGMPHAINPGDTLEFSCDYIMFANNSVANETFMDFFFTTNGVSYSVSSGVDEASKQEFGTDPDGQIGVRLSQRNFINSGNWPDGSMGIKIDPAASDSVLDGSVNLNLLGISDLGTASNDIESVNMNVVFSALKTTAAGVWDLTVEINNQSGGNFKTVTVSNWTNEALYNASADGIYFAMYSPAYMNEEEGVEMDNLNLRVILGEHAVPPEQGFNAFVTLYGLSGVITDDADSDGLKDYGEYVFGGNPVNGFIDSTNPTFDPVSGSYTCSLIGDDTVVAHVLTNSDLVAGSWGTNATISVSATDGVLGAYTNVVDTSAEQLFIKLTVE
jgi:hypothetical protein